MTSLLKYFKGYLTETILGPVFKLLEAIFELCVPLIIAHLVDQVIPQKETSGVVMMVGALFLFASFGVVVAITAQYFSSKAAVGFTREMTKDLYDKILSLPKNKRDRIGTSSLVTRLTSDTYQIQVGINLFLRLFFEGADYCLWLYYHGLYDQSEINPLVLGDGGHFDADYCHHVSDCQSALCKDSENHRQDGHGDTSAISRDASDSGLWTTG